MLSLQTQNNEYLRGCIYTRKGEYCEIYIKNNIQNVAAFVARAYLTPKVELVDSLDCLVLSTMGMFLDQIYSQEYRSELLEHLIPMQQNIEEIPAVEVADMDYEECYGVEKDEYLTWITESTGYCFN